jgi:hypothetical protein
MSIFLIVRRVVTLVTTHEPLEAQNDEINVNIELLQPYPVVAAGVLLEIGAAVI